MTRANLLPAFNDVIEFHEVTGAPHYSIISVPADSRRELRWRLIDEEVNRELRPALEENNVVEIADAIADAIYVLLGTAAEYGIPIHLVWEAVHAANMAKADPVTGKVLRREDGKILKPAGWQPADIKKILEPWYDNLWQYP